MRNGSKRMTTKFECNIVQDFIDDNKEIAFLYMLKQENGSCMEMCDFIEEMDLMPKFLMYSHMRASMDE